MNPVEEFEQEKREAVAGMAGDAELQALSRQWFDASCRHKYSYHFSWMGRPIIQYPQDVLAMQEIIWQVQPDLIIETGIAHGGSLVMYASLLSLMGHGEVLGIDVDIRAHNREAIESHPMAGRIRMIEGSSIAPDVVSEVKASAQGKGRVMVVLDSNHTHAHVRRELELYAPLVTKGSYLVVFDTVIEDMPADYFTDRPWGHGDNPKTAVHEFLNGTDRFVIDRAIQDKLLLTAAPDGYLKCVKAEGGAS